MCERFGVGRGVIREAVKMLDAMGLVESRQGSGIYVRNNPIPSISRAFTLSVTPEEQSIAALFEFRTVLETASVAFAAERHTPAQMEAIHQSARVTVVAAQGPDSEAWHHADREFHRTISAASANPYLSVAIDALRQMQYNVVRLITGVPYSTAAAEQHLAIAAAIAARQPQEAAARMRGHIAYTAGRIHQAREPAGSGAGVSVASGV
jgi:GntR family transcriptional repressor for pyruvate dehydrogenase complex